MATTNNSARRRELLAASSWFEGLPGEALAYVAENSRLVTYEKGRPVVGLEEPFQFICLVISGRLRSSRTNVLGGEYVGSLLGPGALCNLMGIYEQTLCPWDVVAEDRAELVEIPNNVVRDASRKFPDFAEAIAKALAYRLRKSLFLLHQIALEPLGRRIQRMLVQMARARTGDDSSAYILHITQERLGHLVKASRPKVNRELQEFSDRNLLRIGYGTITILDLQRLEGEIETIERFPI